MDLGLTALELARIQFAFTVSFHIIFPAISIGLASFLAVLEWRWLKTNDPVYKDLFKFWIKIFALSFGMSHNQATKIWDTNSIFGFFCLHVWNTK